MGESAFALLVFVGLFFLFFVAGFAYGAPDGVTIDVDANETKTATSAGVLNTSGGYITTINITASTQNPRWKAFVGRVAGTFTLDDATGSTIYDWSIATVGGEVYATRNSSTIAWSSIKCANTTLMEFENGQMSHSSADDNITATFSDTTHAEFFVGAVNITTDTCPTLNTYIGNVTQDNSFEEVVLSDSNNFTAGGNLIFTTVMEDDLEGFDGTDYDFQMIVPENGAQGFSGQTAYYLYVELS